jgi:hypothetical protein
MTCGCTGKNTGRFFRKKSRTDYLPWMELSYLRIDNLELLKVESETLFGSTIK